MEFDDLITFILLFAFFILPSILKGRGKKKKPVRVKKKRASIFGKLGEGIQNFVRELEKQAQAAKQTAGASEQGSVWEDLAEPDEIEPDLSENIPSPAPERTQAPKSYDPDYPFIRQEKTPIASGPVPVETGGEEPAVSGIRAGIPAHSLQQAVVWSEILGKPVALRNE